MLKRKIEEKLQFWFENRKQALLVKGARQIGKSYSIRRFIKNKFTNIIEIDFSERTDLNLKSIGKTGLTIFIMQTLYIYRYR